MCSMSNEVPQLFDWDQVRNQPGDRWARAELNHGVVEFVAPTRLRRTLIDALRAAHPYEEPAFDVIAVEDTSDLSRATGLGRIGELPEPVKVKTQPLH